MTPLTPEMIERAARAIHDLMGPYLGTPEQIAKHGDRIAARQLETAEKYATVALTAALSCPDGFRLVPVEATAVEDWQITVDEPVLIYVVHDHAQYEPDEAKRKAEWEGWFTGRWIHHNSGGWTWQGMSGRVTHVAPLPSAPSQDAPPPRSLSKKD